MVQIDLLLRGVPGRTDQGYLGQSTAALIDGVTLVDTGGNARQPLLKRSLDAVDISPEDIEHVLLTHLHFDHCNNVDLFPNADVFVYDPELDRVERGDFDWATTRAFEPLTRDQTVTRFDEGEVIDGIEAIHTPGHVEHHVSFVLEADRTYGLTGDAIKNLNQFVTRNPVTLYDDGVARETIENLAGRLDFVVPGHDTPFYITPDGGATPCGDVDVTLSLQTGSGASSRVRVSSSRLDTRPLPDGITDVSEHQSIH